MEFSDTAKANALKFLEELTKKGCPPGDAPLPVLVQYPQLCLAEVEPVCLDMAKTYLARLSCPGILSYYISAETYSRLSSNLEKFLTSDVSIGDGEARKEMYAGESLARGLLSVLHSVCEEWSGNLPFMTAPKDKVELSIFAIKNTRRKMEDRHAVCVDVNSLYSLKGFPHQAYYAVFDGHIGVEAASYASVCLLTNIVRHQAFQDDPQSALKAAIKMTDENFCNKNLPRSGTTAVACLLRGDKLYTGWVGDSQAMIVRRGVPTQLVAPHKPDSEEEQRRIEEAGGMVIWNGAWRVNGNLSVSRAIGDAPDKKFVIGEGDLSVADIDGTEDYLMLACDGVWDVLSMEEIATCVSSHLSSPGGSRQTVAKAIIQLAKSEGSGDNMTVIVSFFGTFQPAKNAEDTPTSDSEDTPPSDSAGKKDLASKEDILTSETPS